MNIRFLHLIVISCVLFLFSCNSKKRSLISDAVNLHCHEIPIDFMLGNPYQIKKSGDLLIIADRSSNNALYLYDYKNHSLQGSAIGVGQGPNDVIHPLIIDVLDKDRLISIFQRQMGKYTEHPLDSVLNGVFDPMNTMQFLGSSDRLIKAGNNYITAGTYDDCSIAIYDNKGCHIRNENIYPQYINKLTDPENKYIYGQGVISYNPSVGTLAFAASFTGEILFFNTGNVNKFEKIQGYDLSLSPSFKNRISDNPQDSGIRRTDIDYCADICSTINHVYVLYRGLSMEEKKHADYSYILKFSSKGEFIQSYRTNVNIISFCVDDDKKLFAIALSEDLEYILVEADM